MKQRRLTDLRVHALLVDSAVVAPDAALYFHDCNLCDCSSSHSHSQLLSIPNPAISNDSGAYKYTYMKLLPLVQNPSSTQAQMYY